MEQLQYKTRENTTPHGKAGVYFTAHPADMSVHLEDTQNQILYLQDCVIWHDPEVNRQIDDVFLSELSFMNMQLMVIAVTKKLLTEPNRVTEKELPFALEHHIAVLPIMMEEELDALYPAVFGDLQYLNSCSEDETAIPYMEKLGKHLESVLVGDETVQLIHSAFDAQIFLSYRKKDRRIAQELMELIQKIPEMESVGIWYDEFLIPGEGFNSGIQSAIKQSDLFVLAVTPNLVNEDNFVREFEYKWAKKEYQDSYQIRIIPAKMEETDQVMMQDSFPGIRDNVDARREDALSPALLDPLEGKLHDHDDPMHKYLLGLAYLHGIEMLPNSEKGVTLIQQAATDGVLDAKKKLVQMYFRGHGVARDYAMSIHWQYQVVASCKACYEETGSDEDWFQYTWELVYLGDDLVHMSRWEEAVAAFTDARRLLEEKLQKEENLRYRERLVYVGQELGLAYTHLNRDTDAIDALEKAVCAAEQCPKADASLLLRRYHTHAHCNLGAVYQSIGQSSNALYHCQKAMELSSSLLDEDHSKDTVRLNAEAFYQLGNIYSDHGQWDQAEVHCVKALELMKQIAGQLAKIEDRLFMVECLRLAGRCKEYQEDYETAETAYQKSLAISKGLLQIQETEQILETVWRAQQNLDTLQIRIDGKRGEVRPLFVKNADSRVSEDPSVQNRRMQIDAHTQWAKACVRGRNFQKAQVCFRKVINLLEALSQQSQDPKDTLALCLTKIELAEALQRANQKDSLLAVLAQVIKDCNALYTEDTDGEDQLAIRRTLARAYIYRGRFFQNMDHNFAEEAVQCFLKALPLLEQLVEKTSHLHMRLFFAECKADIAVNAIYTKKDEYTHYINDYSTQALAEMETLYQLDQTLETTKCMAKCYESRALVLWYNDRQQDAQPYFAQAYRLYLELSNKTKEAYYQSQGAVMRLFTAKNVSGKKKKHCLQEALTLAEKACATNPFDRQSQEIVAIIKNALKQA